MAYFIAIFILTIFIFSLHYCIIYNKKEGAYDEYISKNMDF